MATRKTADGKYAGRPGGDRRGSAEDRRRRKHWMLRKFGDGEKCRCQWCRTRLRFDTVEADRLDPLDSYRRRNVVPACRTCNLSRGNKTLPEWQKKMKRKGLR